MAYLDSNKVAVFPSSSRELQQARLLTEQRITTFVKNSLDVYGFVVDFSAGYISFYLMGYFFACNILEFFTGDVEKTLYATITMSRVTDTETIGSDVVLNSSMYNHISGVDEEVGGSWKYKGIDISTTPTGDYLPERNIYIDGVNNTYCLCLGTYNNPGWTSNTSHFKIQKAKKVVEVDNTISGETESIHIDCGTFE